jgi:Subtilase family
MASEGTDASAPRPELIVVAHPDAALEVHGTRVRGAGTAGPLEQALVETGAQARPLFGPSEARIRAQRDESPWDLPDLSLYYHVAIDDDHDDDHEAVAARLAEDDNVAGAYLKPAVAIDDSLLPASAAADAAAPMTAVTANFDAHQGHLDAAPNGVGARTAWGQTGGTGSGVSVVVVGGAWRLDHEDLAGGVGAMLGNGTPIDAVSFRNHGTAALGLVRANRNSIGVTGVAPDCQIRTIATFGLGTAAAIHAAADALGPGGIVLIEWQRPGPGATGVGSAGFLPLEWWPDDFASIAFATAKGVIVVEPAGNGSVSLDDPRYDTPAPGFPATWKNPFKHSQADCGAILVGAGAPPPTTHGNDHGPDRSRLGFSNHGSSLDVQGWGAELTTLAYGDLQGGPDERVWYTDGFGGTSGAAAMVAGVVASLQGMQIIASAKRPPLTPADVRRLLRQSGSAQAAGPDGTADSHRIGTRPDLIALQGLLVVTKDESKDNKETKENKDNKDNKDNKEQKESKDKEDKDNKDNKDNKEQKEDKEDKDQKDHTIEKVRLPIEKSRIPVETSPPLVPEGEAGGEPSARAEATIVSHEPVRHFISDGLRPELATAHLVHEPDFAGRSVAEVADELRPPEETAGDEVPAGV